MAHLLPAAAKILKIRQQWGVFPQRWMGSRAQGDKIGLGKPEGHLLF
jgi:hypothetical protein